MARRLHHALYIALLFGCASWVLWAHLGLPPSADSTLPLALVWQMRAAAWLALIVVVCFASLAMRPQPDGAERASLDHELSELRKTMEQIRRESGLSEAAKSVLHRRHERELLRQAIEQDIRDGDWDAAMILVKELAERFGYRADAEEFRGRIEHARASTLDRQVMTSLERLDALLLRRDWTEAAAEAAKIVRLYPDSPRIDGLVERVRDSRHRYKLDLERRFLHAAEREEIELAMSLLKELDIYLDAGEAEPFREVARGVIGKARDNLGVRFKLAVQDQAWDAALEVGDRIIRDFPNTRMAEEVRTMLAAIRERATTVRTPRRSGATSLSG